MSQKKKPGELASDLVDSLLKDRSNKKRASTKQTESPSARDVDPIELDETKSFVFSPGGMASLPQSTSEESNERDETPQVDPFLSLSPKDEEESVPFINFEVVMDSNPKMGSAKADQDKQSQGERTLEASSDKKKQGHDHPTEMDFPNKSERMIDSNKPVDSTRNHKFEEATRALTQFKDKINAAFKASNKGVNNDAEATKLTSSEAEATRAVDEKAQFERSLADHKEQAAVRFGQGRMAQNKQVNALRGSGGVLAASEATLAQSESLRFAQDRILDLEREVDRLRRENEQLAAAGETLNLRLDELFADNERLKTQHQETLELQASERKGLRESIQNKRVEAELLQRKVDELEMRLASDLKKIRVRERELENRLELLKMEGAALLRSKDEMILELKREVDKLMGEAHNYRNKNQELHRLIENDQEKFRRTVRALRLALSMLESEDENVVALKKAK